MQQLSGLDASFLYLETPSQPMHIGSLVIYDTGGAGPMPYEDVLDHFRGRLQFARCFRQRLARVPLGLDHPYWIEDPDFDLEFHVHQLALPGPGSWDQLVTQCARLFSRPLDMKRPLWEVTIIEGLDDIPGIPKGSVGVASKVHHAAIDGVSGAEMFAAVHDLEPNTTRDEPDPWKPEQPPELLELMRRAAFNNVTRPMRFMRTVGRSLPLLAGVIRRTRRHELQGPVARAPHTRFNDRVSPHHVFDGRSFELDAIKRIRKQVDGATVNDAILTLVGGALRTYLEEKGELPDQPLVAFAPISVRTEDQAGNAGNKVSGMFPSLRTDVADPLERLAAVSQSTTEAKALHDAIGASTLTDYTEFGPMRLAGLAARLSARTGLLAQTGVPFNCVVTNVPGPPFPLYLRDAPAIALYGTGPIVDHFGLMHPVFSYNGDITVSITGCREQLPDPGHYADLLQASFDELAKAAD